MHTIEFEFEQKDIQSITLHHIAPHQSILEVAAAHQIELHHNCGGVCACTTCHIYIETGEDCLSEITDREEDYIDRAVNPTLQSRLSCQAMLFNKSGHIKIRIPDQSQFLGE